MSAATVRPPRLWPAFSAPSHPAFSPAGGIWRYCRTAGLECLVEAAAGLWGGIYSGVLPTGSTRGRSAPRLHAVWGRAGQRARWRHLQGSALAALLLLLKHIAGVKLTAVTSLRRHLMLHLKCVRTLTGQVASNILIYMTSFANSATLMYVSCSKLTHSPAFKYGSQAAAAADNEAFLKSHKPF